MPTATVPCRVTSIPAQRTVAGGLGRVGCSGTAPAYRTRSSPLGWCPVRALLIVNPNATSTTPAARDLLAHAVSSRVQVRVAHTTHRGHAGELARRAALEGIGLIVVHGGDG